MRLPTRPLKSLRRRLLDPYIGTIIRIATSEPAIALTFDDGPHPDYTPLLLDILQRYGAKATFFVVGQVAKEQPELIQRLRQEGHALGNHSWSHPAFPEISGRARRWEVRHWEAALGRQPVPLFRPPWGRQTMRTRLDLLQLGYKVVTWNATAKDWLLQSPSDLAAQLVAAVQPGSIVLLHDAIFKSRLAAPQFDRHYMLTGLEIALRELSHAYRFVTVPTLLTLGRPVYKIWQTETAT